MTLFESQAPRPLADRLRPQTLAEVVGQEHLLAPEAPLGRMVAAGSISRGLKGFFSRLSPTCSGGKRTGTCPTLLLEVVPMRLDHSPFFRSTVGFDRLLDLLDTADTREGYPPYNIERSDENN